MVLAVATVAREAKVVKWQVTELLVLVPSLTVLINMEMPKLDMLLV